MLHLRPVLTYLKPKTLLPLADLALVNVSVLAGLWLWTVRDDFRVFNTQFVWARAGWFPAVSAVWLLLAVSQEFYHRHTVRRLFPSLTALLGTTSLLLVLYFALYFFAPRDNTLPRGVFLSIAGISFLLVGAWRLIYIALTAGLSRQDFLMLFRPASSRAAVEGSAQVTSGEPALPVDQVLTVQEVAERLKVSQATVWRWCQSGKLPAFRVGQQWRIRAADLQRVMNANRLPD